MGWAECCLIGSLRDQSKSSARQHPYEKEGPVVARQEASAIMRTSGTRRFSLELGSLRATGGVLTCSLASVRGLSGTEFRLIRSCLETRGPGVN